MIDISTPNYNFKYGPMDLSIEQKYIKQGYDFVIGIDEAGRGPLAGPVIASAVTLTRNFQFSPPAGGFNQKLKKSKNKTLLDVKDSKKITPKGRDKLFELLTNNENIKYGVGIISEKIIDEKNILQATLMAMQEAIKDLIKKEPKINPQNSIILIDGRDILENLDFDQKSIINGDNKVWSIAAASIIAKVTRDGIMQKYHEKYPQYCFNKHKGYGTKLHFEMIAKHGQCGIHRKSFLD